jgi:L-threonylcarbamoyladenylate synthase
LSLGAIPCDLARATSLLRAGELVAIPTETVYGLGANARDPHAVAKIFAAKGRPADHPLIVHLPDASHMASWAIDIPAAAHALAAAFWPGPLTLILKRHASVPDAVTGGQDTVGLRVPNHPLALALLREFDGGIAAPSANRFGRISPTTAQHVRDEFDSRIPVLDGGACAVGIESTIIDLSRGTPVILRPGQIGAAELVNVLGASVDDSHTQSSDTPRVSGSLDAHYAPRTPLRLVAAGDIAQAHTQARARGDRVALLVRLSTLSSDEFVNGINAPHDAPGYAHDLYANLRALDALACDLILVETPPNDAAWEGVADRLRRAAVGSGHAP